MHWMEFRVRRDEAARRRPRQPVGAGWPFGVAATFPRMAALWALLVLGWTTACRGQELPEVVVELERQRIYEGEQVRYQVTLNHVENPTPPDLSGFDDFDVKFVGDQSLDIRQVQIINNVRRETVRYGRVYQYLLTPKRSGRLTIPAPTAVVDGKSITGRALQLDVVAPENQDVAILELTCDRQAVYPTEPFTVTLTVAIKSLPAPYEKRDPLSVLSDLPALSIPWVVDDNLPNGLEPEVGWQRWLGSLQNRRGTGFNVNNLSGSSVFSLFERELAFLPQPRRTTRVDFSGAQTPYYEYSFARKFVSKKSGDFTFGPVSLKGTFASGLESGNRLTGQSIFAVARPIVVTVRSVPLEGRPDSFIGAVGRFEVSAELLPKEARVGDPMTLTLTVRGEGTLDDVFEPNLSRVPKIAEGFRVYEATSKTDRGSKEFTYALRPLAAEITEFPSVPVAYFDVDREKYIELHTDPIPISIQPASRLSSSDITQTAGDPRTGQSVEQRAEGIFANVTDLAALRNDAVSPQHWFLTLGGMAGLYVMAVVSIRHIQRRGGDSALARRRAAPGVARRLLQQALEEIDANNERDAAAHLRDALVGLVADVANVPPAGMTVGDLTQYLARFSVDGNVVKRLSGLLETCDGARYGASDRSLRGLGREATTLLDDLLAELKKARVLR